MTWTLPNLLSHASRPAFPHTNRRHRVPVGVLIGADWMEASVREASGCDLRLEVDEPFSIGEFIEIDLRLSDPQTDIRISGVVHWSRRDTRGNLIGVVLTRPVPREFLAVHPDCQRASIRFETDLEAQLEWQHGDVTSRVRLVNYSRTGASLQSATMPVVGASFRLAWQCRTAARTMLGCVRWVTGQASFFLVGCQLLDGLGYEFSGVDVAQSPVPERR